MFTANKFVRGRRDTHREIIEYPRGMWINCRTGAIEFIATVQANNLVYLDWEMKPRAKFAKVSLEELHA